MSTVCLGLVISLKKISVFDFNIFFHFNFFQFDFVWNLPPGAEPVYVWWQLFIEEILNYLLRYGCVFKEWKCYVTLLEDVKLLILNFISSCFKADHLLIIIMFEWRSSCFYYLLWIVSQSCYYSNQFGFAALPQV